MWKSGRQPCHETGGRFVDAQRQPGGSAWRNFMRAVGYREQRSSSLNCMCAPVDQRHATGAWQPSRTPAGMIAQFTDGGSAADGRRG